MKRQLHVILRTSDRAIINSSRIVNVSRMELILKCLKSLVDSINFVSNPNLEIKFTVLDDHSSNENISKIEKIVNTCKFGGTVYTLPGPTNNFKQSAFAQFDSGRNSQDFVYMVEDDYFHSVYAIEKMFNAWMKFREMTDFLDVAIYPYDSTHLYDGNKSNHIAKIFYLDNQYWRTTCKTANTMFIHSSTIKKYWEPFEHLAVNYPDVTEDETINRLYNNFVETGGPICLFSPMPSLAVHVSYDMPKEIDTSFVKWHKLFQETKI